MQTRRPKAISDGEPREMARDAADQGHHRADRQIEAAISTGMVCAMATSESEKASLAFWMNICDENPLGC